MSEKLAYAAGIMDGEGSVGLYRKSSTQRFRYPKCSVDNTSIELVEFMHKYFGGSLTSRKRKSYEKDLYRWQIQGQRCMDFLEDVLPYLKEKEKVRRAKLILSQYKKITKYSYTEKEAQKKIDFESEFYKNSERKRFLKGVHNANTKPRPIKPDPHYVKEDRDTSKK